MILIRALATLVLLALAAVQPAHADEAALRETIAKFASSRNFNATAEIVRELGATGDATVERVLTARELDNFPLLNVTVRPKRGRALIWPSVLDADPRMRDTRTDHEAVEVRRGVKYAANYWLHMFDFQAAVTQNCDNDEVFGNWVRFLPEELERGGATQLEADPLMSSSGLKIVR